MEYSLDCTQCGKAYLFNVSSQTCERCGGTLEVVYRGPPHIKIDRDRMPNFWDYETVLPSSRYKHYELGGTKLIRDGNSKNIFLKLELDNPTRSFKDRGSVVEIAKAVEYDFDEIAVASTGNMGLSLAYYARLAGIKARVFISKSADKDKIKLIKAQDATVVNVDGDFNKAMGLASAYCSKNKAFLTGDYCYRKEGQKTIAYEIIAQIADVKTIVAPVGNATLLSGLYKALTEMRSSSLIRSLPVLVGVQASGCAPLYNAFVKGKRIEHVNPQTKAGGIAVGLPTFGYQALDAIRRTSGRVVTVSDAEMEAEQKRFFEEHGLVAELAGVASLAAVRKYGLYKDGAAVAVISGGNV